MDTVKQSSLMEERAPVDSAAQPLDLGLELDKLPPSVKKPSRKWLVWTLAVAGLLGAGAVSWKLFSKPAAPAYSVATVRRGNLATTISATGKVQAVTTVQVGTQVSGTVSELHADFNDHVKAGQVIARLDPSQIQAQLQQSQASYAAATAAVATARSTTDSQAASVQASKANVDRADAALVEAGRLYKNTAAMVEAGVTPARQLQIDESAQAQSAAQKAQAEAQYRQTIAQQQASKSQLDQAIAQATQAKAAVDVAAVNLDRTIIKSPIDGVVVSRNVDVGQTVAASLQAPTIFLIAQDLTKMQVLADIDEADVGQLSPASKVSFTVDAFPTETFGGKISQIRLSPTVVQNVVTYTAVIDVANPDMKLKPGMTATVTATVAEKQDVLLVPNAALRYRPETAQAAPVKTAPAQAAKSGTKSGTKTGTRGPGSSSTVLWKVEGKDLKPVRVRVGMSDGISTEVSGEGLAEGDQIATAGGGAQAANSKKQATTASPFAPASSARKGRF